MKKPRIFVSYSRKDQVFTQRLVDDLKTAGAQVWYDMFSLNYGDTFTRIHSGVHECEWLVLVLTPASVASPFVQDEVKRALRRVQQRQMRAVIPVLATPVAPNDVPVLWNWIAWVDATRDYGAALASILHIIGLCPQVVPGSPIGASESPWRASLRRLTAWLAFSRIVSRRPASARGTDLIARGRARIAKNQYGQAARIFQRATQQEPRNENAWFNMGVAYYNSMHWPDALAAYDQALAFDPQNTSTWTAKGAVLNDLRRYAEALVALDRALDLDRNNAAAWTAKGWALHNLELYVEALAAHDCAIAVQPTGMRLRNKALTLRALKCEPEAEEAERRAKELGG